MFFSFCFQPESGNIYLILFLKMGTKSNPVFDKSQKTQYHYSTHILKRRHKHPTMFMIEEGVELCIFSDGSNRNVHHPWTGGRFFIETAIPFCQWNRGLMNGTEQTVPNCFCAARRRNCRYTGNKDIFI